MKNKSKLLATLVTLVLTSSVTFAASNVTIGDNSSVDGNSVAIGEYSEVKNSSGNSVAIGPRVTIDGENSIAIGAAWETDNPDDINDKSKVRHTTVNGQDSIAIGNANTTVNGNFSLALGSSNSVEGNHNVALGTNISIKDKNNVVVLGNASTIDRDNAVSIGSEKIQRQLVNVAAATKDTDAVNFKQVKEKISQANTSLDTTLTNKGLNFKADQGQYHSNLGGTIAINGDSKNISTEFTNNSVKIKLADDLNVNSVTAKTVTADTGKFKNLTADKANISDLTVNTIQLGNGETYLTPDGLDANGHKIVNVADGTERTDAVNYGQLDDRISSDGKTVTIFAKDTANTIDVRGTDADGNRINRVIAGINTDADDPTSAANVGYVNSTANALSNKMDSGFAKLGKQVKNVGANAAALAALHPQDFDEDYKFSVAAGVGNYKGKNGTAIGAFYRPNQDLIFSVGGTFGDDAMVNAGISYKFGHSDTSKKVVSTSALEAINKKLDELAAQNARLRTQNERLLNFIYRIKPKRESFPDVPTNHWAAEAVETLHANDVIKGYPDGEFKGDQKMSRYEYAEMLYNSLPKADEFTK